MKTNTHNFPHPDIIAAEIDEDLPPSPRLWRDKPSRSVQFAEWSRWEASDPPFAEATSWQA
jgi:hypothetical protein